MESLANQAFEHIRITLTTLQPKSFTNIEATLMDIAILASRGQRAFQVSFASEGVPWPLSTFVKQKIFAIFREAVTNVQKHSDASQLEIRFLWAEALLTISVADDGNGMDMTFQAQDDHYGIAIMHERAKEFHGRLEIQSNLGPGTFVTLYLPMDP